MPRIGVRVAKEKATTPEGALKFGYEVTKGKDGKLYYRKSAKKSAPPKPSVPPFKEQMKVVKAPPMGASFVVVEKDGKRMLVKAKPMKKTKVVLRTSRVPVSGVVVAGKKAIKKVRMSEKLIGKKLSEYKKDVDRIEKELKKLPAKKSPVKRARKAPAKRKQAVRKPLTEDQKERRRFMARRRYGAKTMPKKVAKCKKIGMVLDPANPFF